MVLRQAERLRARPWAANPCSLRGYNHETSIEDERLSDGTGGREARSQWFERLVRTGGHARQEQTVENSIRKPRPPRSHMRA